MIHLARSLFHALLHSNAWVDAARITPRAFPEAVNETFCSRASNEEVGAFRRACLLSISSLVYGAAVDCVLEFDDGTKADAHLVLTQSQNSRVQRVGLIQLHGIVVFLTVPPAERAFR